MNINIFHIFTPKKLKEVQKNHDILADFVKKDFLNSCFDQLPMHLSQFGFVSLKEHVEGYHLHVLKLHIAHGKRV